MATVGVVVLSIMMAIIIMIGIVSITMDGE